MDDILKTVLIVGGGLAGIISAAAARKNGAKVILVTSGPGTLAMSGGSINTEGMDLANPYLEQAMELFRDVTTIAGCEYSGMPREQHLIPNVMGNFQKVSMAPASVWSGSPVYGDKVVVLGIRGLSSFSPFLIAEVLNYSALRQNLQVEYIGKLIEVPWLPKRSFNNLDLAHLLEDQQKRDSLAEIIKPLVQEANLLLLPAILGQKTGSAEFAAFTKMVGCSVAEMSTVPPSVVGLRVYQALLKYLQKNGVELNIGYPVQALQIQAGRCTAAILATPGRKRIIRADNFILATGRINKNEIIINNENGTIAHHFTEGIAVNKNMQLLKVDKIPFAANLFGAGSILEGFVSRNGNAQAILSGYQAGIIAAGVI